MQNHKPTLEEHVIAHMSCNTTAIMDILKEWSNMCMTSINRKDASKAYLRLVTEKVILDLIPWLGLDPHRPWASLDIIRHQIKREMDEKYSDELRRLTDLIASYKRVETDLSKKLTESERNRKDLLEVIKKLETKRSGLW